MKKFPPEAYAQIDPTYELLDDGMVRHRETLVIRPKLYSRLPNPFRVGQQVKVVDGTSQFPVGSVYKVSLIEGEVMYVDNVKQGERTFNQVAICWERLDPA